jgi:hypothetical protein
LLLLLLLATQVDIHLHQQAAQCNQSRHTQYRTCQAWHRLAHKGGAFKHSAALPASVLLLPLLWPFSAVPRIKLLHRPLLNAQQQYTFNRAGLCCKHQPQYTFDA